MDRRYGWYRWITGFGLRVLRRLRQLGRRLAPILQKLAGLFGFLYRKTLGDWVESYRKNRAAFRKYRNQRGKLAAQRAAVLRKTLVCSVFNMIMPVLAIAVLLGTIAYWNQMAYGLSLECEGENIGVLEDEAVFEEASDLLYHKVSYDAVSQTALPATPVFQIQPAIHRTYLDAGAVCDTLLENSDKIVKASGLYLNGSLLGAVTDSAALSAYLQELLDTEKTAYNGEDACFLESVELVEGLFATDHVKSFAEIKQLLTGSVQEKTEYRAKKGDTVEAVAQKQALPVLFLSEDNGGISGKLKAGTVLNICKRQQLLHVLVVHSETYEQEIPYDTVTTEDDTLYSDETIVTSAGEPGREERTDRVSCECGKETERENIKRTVLTKPVAEQVTVGTQIRPTGEEPGVASGVFSWPAPTLWTVTSEYGARWGTVHRGLDISGSGATGQPIVASDAGVVSWVAFDDYGYGYHVEVDHGNGFVTRYAHASDIVVTQGQKVAKGELLAYVGNTGDSQGAHLHFEIIDNGTQMDPRLYLE